MGMGVLFVFFLDGAARFETEEVTFWFLHAVHPGCTDFSSSPTTTDDEAGDQDRKDHKS